MDLKKAIKFLEGRVTELEQATYMFDTVVKPRYEADKAILGQVRSQLLKLQAIQEKLANKEAIDESEALDAIPPQFR